MNKGIIVLGLLLTQSALAECYSQPVCDSDGNCDTQDICDSSLDLPSTNVPDITPLPSTEIEPLPSTAVPPVGTDHCTQTQVNGYWQTVCY